jgi:hypothetical protein
MVRPRRSTKDNKIQTPPRAITQGYIAGKEAAGEKSWT